MNPKEEKEDNAPTENNKEEEQPELLPVESVKNWEEPQTKNIEPKEKAGIDISKIIIWVFLIFISICFILPIITNMLFPSTGISSKDVIEQATSLLREVSVIFSTALGFILGWYYTSLSK